MAVIRKRIWFKPYPDMSRYGVLLKRRIGWRMLYLDGQGRLHRVWSFWPPIYEDRELWQRPSNPHWRTR